MDISIITHLIFIFLLIMTFLIFPEYSISSVGISNYYDTNGVSVTTNRASPFEFLDDVEIEEMKFLL